MKKANQPNLVLIMTDQQRGDCLGIAGHPVLQTPNLDYMAARGARFTSAYTECPICIPARHTLMTGMSPDKTGCVGWVTNQRIADPSTTLPNLLRLAGYQTAMIGRGMHQYPGFKRYGFETLMPGDPYRDKYSRVNPPAQSVNAVGPHGLGPNDVRVYPWTQPEEHHEVTHTVNRSLEWLAARDQESPFFLSVGFVAPHPPLCPLPFFFERYRRMEMPEPAVGTWAKRPADDGLGLYPHGFRQVLEGERNQDTAAAYFALINQVDHQLYRLFNALAALKNTYILFTSDHGESLGDHYLWRKNVPYEGSTHIPFLLRGPGIKPGTVSSGPVGLQDVLPTFCDLAGVDIPSHVTGRSLLTQIQGANVRDYIHGEVAPLFDLENNGDHEHPGYHYLTDGAWKYIWAADGVEQLFNLVNDPREITDLSGNPNHSEKLILWRNRLIQKLMGRPEGFTDGQRLIPGRPYKDAMPHAVLG